MPQIGRAKTQDRTEQHLLELLRSGGNVRLPVLDNHGGVGRISADTLVEVLRCMYCFALTSKPRRIKCKCVGITCKDCFDAHMRSGSLKQCPHCRTELNGRRDATPDAVLSHLTAAVIGEPQAFEEQYDAMSGAAAKVEQIKALHQARTEAMKKQQAAVVAEMEEQAAAAVHTAQRGTREASGAREAREAKNARRRQARAERARRPLEHGKAPLGRPAKRLRLMQPSSDVSGSGFEAEEEEDEEEDEEEQEQEQEEEEEEDSDSRNSSSNEGAGEVRRVVEEDGEDSDSSAATQEERGSGSGGGVAAAPTGYARIYKGPALTLSTLMASAVTIQLQPCHGERYLPGWSHHTVLQLPGDTTEDAVREYVDYRCRAAAGLLPDNSWVEHGLAADSPSRRLHLGPTAGGRIALWVETEASPPHALRSTRKRIPHGTMLAQLYANVTYWGNTRHTLQLRYSMVGGAAPYVSSEEEAAAAAAVAFPSASAASAASAAASSATAAGPTAAPTSLSIRVSGSSGGAGAGFTFDDRLSVASSVSRSITSLSLSLPSSALAWLGGGAWNSVDEERAGFISTAITGASVSSSGAAASSSSLLSRGAVPLRGGNSSSSGPGASAPADPDTVAAAVSSAFGTMIAPRAPPGGWHAVIQAEVGLPTYADRKRPQQYRYCPPKEVHGGSGGSV